MTTWEELTSKVLTLATVPSGSTAWTFSPMLDAGFGKNLPQSTKGANVTTIPAAAISLRKSRRDTFPPAIGGVCAILEENNSSIINKSLGFEAGGWKARTLEPAAMATSSPKIDIAVGPNVWTEFY